MNVCCLEYEFLFHREESPKPDILEQREISSLHSVFLQYTKVVVTQASFSRILLGPYIPFPIFKRDRMTGMFFQVMYETMFMIASHAHDSQIISQL